MKKITFLFLLILLAGIGRISAQGCLDGPKGDGAAIIGYMQPQFDYKFLGEDTAGYSLNTSTFKFNRARFGVAGSIPYDIEYYALIEMSGFFTGNPFLCDAFITYTRLGHWAKISMGSFKSPISQELNTACNGLYTINRSKVVDELTNPNRDLGIMVLGKSDSLTIFGKKTFNLFKYSVAFTNGTGLNALDKNNGKMLSGRLVVSPFSFLSIGGSYQNGVTKDKSQNADHSQDTKTRYGFDAEIKYKNFVVQGEYLFGKDKGTYTTGGGCGGAGTTVTGTIERSGFMGMIAYMTPWNLQPVVKYETYDPDLSTSGGFQNYIENTITFGVNYFINDWTRVQVNYLYNAEETADVEVPNDALLVQLQVKIK